MKTDPNEAAFASEAMAINGEGYVETRGTFGLTKREYFAAQAMQGLLADGWRSPEEVSVDAVEQADALIAALNENDDIDPEYEAARADQ